MMTYLTDKPDYKVVEYGKHIFIVNKIGLIGTEQNGKFFPLHLSGLGTTGTGSAGDPWLITLCTTRTSYIFFKSESISPTYVGERLNFYDKTELTSVADAVQKILEKL